MTRFPRTRQASLLGAFLVLFYFLFFSLVFAEEIRYDTGDRRDPFAPLVGEGGILAAKSISESGLNVEGIIFDPIEGSMVLIDGELYKQGDQVEDASIIHIYNDRVTFSQNDEEKTIWIREEVTQEGQEENDNLPTSSKEAGTSVRKKT